MRCDILRLSWPRCGRLIGPLAAVTTAFAVSIACGGTIVVDPAQPLALDNSSGTATGLFGGDPLSFRGGTLTVIADPTGPTAGTSGRVTLESGQSLIDMFTSPAAATTFTFDRLDEAGTGTVVFTGGVFNALGDDPGANVANAYFTTAPTLSGSGAVGTAGVGIVPRLLVTGAISGDALTFATYGQGGVRPLAANESVASLAAASAGDNARLIMNETVASSLAVNSLAIVGDGVAADIAAGQTLTVTSGDLIALSGSAGTLLSGPGTLAFGSGGAATAFIAVDGDGSAAGRLTLDALLLLSGLVKSGGGVLSISGSGSLGAGPVAVNAGSLTLQGSGPLADVTTIRVEEGSRLEVTGGTLVSNVGGTLDGAGTLAFVPASAGTIAVGSGTLAISTPIDSSGLVKSGSGTVQLADTAVVGAGGIAVNGGRLVVAGTTALADATMLAVRSGATLDLAATANYGISTLLTGDGAVTGSVVLSGTVDAATADGLPGSLTIDALRVLGDSSLVLRIADAAAGAGAGHGLVTGTGSLDISSLSPSAPLHIVLTTVQADGTPGEALGFDATQDYSWTFAGYGAIVGSFSSASFSIDDGRFLNPHAGGMFAVGRSGGDLAVTYVMSVPEPATTGLLMMALGTVGVVSLGRRLRRMGR